MLRVRCGRRARVQRARGVRRGAAEARACATWGTAGVDCSAHAGCAANQVDRLRRRGRRGRGPRGTVRWTPPSSPRAGGSMRVGRPGDRAAGLGDLCSWRRRLRRRRSPSTWRGCRGTQTHDGCLQRAARSAPACGGTRRACSRWRGRSCLTRGVLQARRFYFVEMRLDWAGRKVSVLLDGKLVAEGVKMRKQCSDWDGP